MVYYMHLPTEEDPDLGELLMRKEHVIRKLLTHNPLQIGENLYEFIRYGRQSNQQCEVILAPLDKRYLKTIYKDKLIYVL